MAERSEINGSMAGAAGKDPRVRMRRRVLKAGRILFSGCVTLECAVRDISDTGARLEFKDAAQVPDTFLLFVELDGLSAECAVAWRRATIVGVSFSAPPRLSAPTRLQVVNAAGSAARPTLRRLRPA